jgi:hypothetical protein
MASNTSRPISRINFPLAVLWLGSVGIASLGYLLMSSGNADQVLVYTAVEADYVKLFAAQSATTVGGMLIAVGVLGVLLALTAQVITRRPSATTDVVVLDSSDIDSTDIESTEADDKASAEGVDAAAAESAVETKAKPTSQVAPKAKAAPKAKVTSTRAPSAKPSSDS